ncbi:MAG: NAD-dependent epimerase/dehydratase family protein [Paracoccaceae bacterium]
MVDDATVRKLQGLRVAVTGAGGFIGRALVGELAKSGARATAVVRGNPGRLFAAAPDVRVVSADLSDADALSGVLGDCDVLFNFAYDMRASGADNLRAFDGLVSAARSAGIARIVHASSVVVYEDWPERNVSESSPVAGPANTYRAAKAAMESRLADLSAGEGTTTICLQPTIVYGPHSFLWTDLPIERLLAGTVVLPGNPEGLCHAVFVGDVVQAALKAAVAGVSGAERCIVSGPAPVGWPDFYRGYAGLLGRGTVELRDLPDPGKPPPGDPGANTPSASARLSAALRRRIGRNGVDWLRRHVASLRRMAGSSVYVPAGDEIRLYKCRGKVSVRHAREILGYRPEFDFAAGLKATSDYVREKYRI